MFLKLHIFLMKKTVDPYFSCPSYASFLSYVSLKTKFEHFVCKISQKVFESIHIWCTDRGWEVDHLINFRELYLKF